MYRKYVSFFLLRIKLRTGFMGSIICLILNIYSFLLEVLKGVFKYKMELRIKLDLGLRVEILFDFEFGYFWVESKG